MSTMPLIENFTLNLRAAMEEQGLACVDLAAKAGLHRVTVSRILHRHLMPTLETCERLAQAAGLRPDTAFLEPHVNSGEKRKRKTLTA